MTQRDCKCCPSKRAPSPLTGGVSFCRHCEETLSIALVNIPAYYNDLNLVRSRQTRYRTSGGGSRSSGATIPLAIDLRFQQGGRGTKAMLATRLTIARWTCMVLRDLPRLYGPVCAACSHTSCNTIRNRRLPRTETVTDCAAYLERNLSLVRRAPYGETMFDEILKVEKELAQLVDRPEDRWYAGPCQAELDMKHDGSSCECSCHLGPFYPCDVVGGCGSIWQAPLCDAQLYAKASEGKIVCPACKTRWDIQERRDWLRASLWEVDLPASECAQAVVALGEFEIDQRKLEPKIRNWAQRNQILAVRHDEWGDRRRPRYRFRDVVELLTDEMRRAQDKRMKRRSA